MKIFKTISKIVPDTKKSENAKNKINKKESLPCKVLHSSAFTRHSGVE